MSARKRRAPTDAQAATDGGSSVPTRADVSVLETTGSYTEATSLLLDPNRVLLRRVFFLDPDKTRYNPVGYYPSRHYQPLVEIGTPKQHPILLSNHHVTTLARQLTAQVDSLWRDEFYVWDGEFAVHSATPYKTAIFTLGVKQNKKSVFLKLQDLRFLTYIFPIVHKQLAKYTEAMADVMTYVLSAINSITYVPPPLSGNKNILYYQLFEEIKTLM